MPCPSEDTLLDLFERRLPDMRDIEEHVDRCENCRMVLAEMGKALASRSPTSLPESATAGPESPAHPLEDGSRVDRFVILRRIGRGGMGIVYAAYDPELDRKVALKLLRPEAANRTDYADWRARLLREAQAMARISHPHVVTVYEVGTFQSQVFVAMELCEGPTLAEWLRAARRPWREVLAVFRDAGRGLAAAHAAGLVHRDFKPQNVLLGSDGRARVADFGLVRPSGVDLPREPTEAETGDGASPLTLPLTQTGAILGTPAYMAPEQYRGHKGDARTDEFSFAWRSIRRSLGTTPSRVARPASSPRASTRDGCGSGRSGCPAG
jgi:serine/threonine protein kinase